MNRKLATWKKKYLNIVWKIRKAENKKEGRQTERAKIHIFNKIFRKFIEKMKKIQRGNARN